MVELWLRTALGQVTAMRADRLRKRGRREGRVTRDQLRFYGKVIVLSSRRALSVVPLPHFVGFFHAAGTQIFGTRLKLFDLFLGHALRRSTRWIECLLSLGRLTPEVVEQRDPDMV